MNSPISFSRSGRSGSDGKNTERISADVPVGLLCDISDAAEAFREHTPTATRAEVIRSLIDEHLNGCIVALSRTYPGAPGMTLDAAEQALAVLEGKTVDEYRRWVMAAHIFGRLHADKIIGDALAPAQPLNESGSGPVPVGKGA
ncbi:hypothetical protein [Zoogloea dura]|uniref:Ribbon-helix-helix protein, CopG family n=1 Tax=Zoogloea dura TaxID=2728840 RepID=A0A848G3Q3_9RHOO|nr:hypothetical protein [Zoogloea dura]NML24311.1 hypothetical protein [Zoogloea dura]